MHSIFSRPTYSRKEKKVHLAISSQSKSRDESITEESVWKTYLRLIQRKQKKNSDSSKHNQTAQKDTNPIPLLIDEKPKETDRESLLMSIDEQSGEKPLINEPGNLVSKVEHPPMIT